MATSRREDRPSALYRETPRYQKQARALGQRVRSYREAHGLTLEEVAERIDADFRHFQRIESGQVNPTLATILRVAEALGVPAYALLAPPGQPTQPDRHPGRASNPVEGGGGVSHGTEDNIKYGPPQANPVPEDDVIVRRVGASVRAARRSAKMSQRLLAEQTGMTVQHLQRIEYGRQNITLKTLARLARALGVSPASLLAI